MNSHNSESVRLAFVAMLRRCADYLSALPADEVEALLDGELELRLSIAPKKGRSRKKTPALDAERLRDIVARLRSMDNRGSGEELLHDVAPTRDSFGNIGSTFGSDSAPRGPARRSR